MYLLNNEVTGQEIQECLQRQRDLLKCLRYYILYTQRRYAFAIHKPCKMRLKLENVALQSIGLLCCRANYSLQAHALTWLLSKMNLTFLLCKEA